MLKELTISQFADKLASKEPAPGGGSTAALAGTLAASLGAMVVNLSIGKKAFEALEEDIKESIKEKGKKLIVLKDRLTELIDDDTQAFNKYMAAMKLPKSTDEEKNIRSDAMTAAAEEIVRVPMDTVKACLEVLENCVDVSKYGNKNAVSDVGVAALMAMAGLEGATLNVKTNLPGLNDEVKQGDILEETMSMVIKGNTLKDAVLENVKKKIG